MRRYFVSGVLIVVPLILTFLVLRFLFETVDGVLEPVLRDILGYYRSGLGVLATILLIFLAGVLTRNLLGARIYRIVEKLLVRFPLVRPIYFASKQLLEGLANEETSSFRQVALIEYPRRGLYTLCFVTSQTEFDNGRGPGPYTICFVPSTPTPVSGFTVLLPSEEVRRINMSVEDALKYLVSGGVSSPDLIDAASDRPYVPNGEVER